jgi:hypothetical protein
MELRPLPKPNKTILLYSCGELGSLCYATLRFQTISSGTVVHWR